MNWYVHVQSSFFFFFFFSFFSLGFSQLPPTQIEAMKNFQNNNNNTTKNQIWDTKNPNPCYWKGVNCSKSNSSITNISLSKFGLSSSDSLTYLCQIDTLESLDLSCNSLDSISPGFIIDCGKISSLKMLNFSNNSLSGVLPKFQGFPGLETLDLSVNSFGGSVDLQLDELIGIKNLILNQNFFNGPIPIHLGKSMVLEKLQLSKNQFEGQIPNELFNYQRLTLIDLSSNSLSGQIPENLTEIVTLARLAANRNNFSGTIPRRISQSVKNLDLSYNGLVGQISADLLSSPNLVSVDLSYNSLVGPIPESLSENLFRLRLGSNWLNGSIPSSSIGKLRRLTYLELQNNSLSGEIPKELGNCVGLELLNLAENKLTGFLPKEMGNLRQLRVLKLQSNQLAGEIPTQFGELQYLLLLNISQNSLTGSIPSMISNLQKLQSINLQDNKLNGSIPNSIGSLTSLLELQLGKNCLSGNIPNMPSNLQIALNLSHNCFEGPIPETLSSLYSLELLDLSYNKFSGKIPIFLTKLTSLTQLLLSNNQLSGSIPLFMPYVLVDTSGNQGLTNSTKKGISVSVAILIAVSVFIGIMIMGLILLFVSRRFYRVNDANLQSEEQLSLPQVINGQLLTTNSIHRSSIDFTAAIRAVSNPTNITIKNRFSTYYKALMPCGRDYYVKKLYWDDKILQRRSHERFGREIEVLGRLNNSNVMVPLAYVLTVDSAYIFYEFTQKGTLFDVLHGDSAKALDWTSRYHIAVGVAQGLSYLHGCISGSLLLLDLSTKSIFLKSLKEPQIGDIELFEVIDPTKSNGSNSTLAGSVGYIPPEYAYRMTLPGNVYSFGVILLELLTGKAAVTEGNELAKWVLSNSINRENLDQILDYNVSKTSHSVRIQMLSVLKVALLCVNVSPEARPKMKTVLSMLLNAK